MNTADEEGQVTCPRCGVRGPNRAAIRQDNTPTARVIDIGYGCAACGHKWGFEYWTDERWQARSGGAPMA